VTSAPAKPEKASEVPRNAAAGSFLRRRLGPRLWWLKQYRPTELAIPATYADEQPPPDPPRIAIVTPSFNQANYLAATIDSVQAQNYPNLVYFVQDGGSTDGSVDVLKSYGDRLRWCSEPDKGQAHAINKAFQQVDGEILAFLNSDDVLLPGALSHVARYFQANPHVDVVYSHRICIDQDGREIGRWLLPAHDSELIKWVDFVPQETMFWRRRVWDAVGPIDESFNFALDWDFILRAHAQGFRFRRLRRFLACFRVYDAQKTIALVDQARVESARLRVRHLGHVPHRVSIAIAVRRYLLRHTLLHIAFRLGLYRA
jgi:glycosyltransferase involved in cell wall biosynthesis